VLRSTVEVSSGVIVTQGVTICGRYVVMVLAVGYRVWVEVLVEVVKIVET